VLIAVALAGLLDQATAVPKALGTDWWPCDQ
jgi:hypothetical protein